MRFKFIPVLVALFALLAPVVTAQETPAAPCPEAAGEIVVALAAGEAFAAGQGQAARYMARCPEIVVTLIEMPASAVDRLGIYRRFWDSQSGEIDIYQTDSEWAAAVAPHAVDLSEHLPDDHFDRYFPAMIDGQTVGGRRVALPLSADAAVLYYRADLLDKYDLSVPATWSALESAALAIQDGERASNPGFAGYVWAGAEAQDLTCAAHEWLTAETGASFMAGDDLNLTDGFVASLARAAGWVGTISPDDVAAYDQQDVLGVWLAGDAAFMRGGLGLLDAVSAADGQFDLAPLPAGASGAAAGCLGGWQLAVSAYSANVEAAVSLAAFMASPEEQKARALSLAAYPTIAALYDDAELADADPYLARLAPVLTTARPLPVAAFAGRVDEASAMIAAAVHGVLAGQVESADAAAALQRDLRRLLVEEPADAATEDTP